MGAITERIGNCGQDMQLHVHPVWAVFDGMSIKETDRFPRNDSLLGRDALQIGDILDIGLKAFQAWGLEVPVAIRTGSLLVNENLYAVFERFGLKSAKISALQPGVLALFSPKVYFYTNLPPNICTF